jgi:dTDP-6-deoxy-L-talose 4-dehydrogenase (NAD+)
VTGASGFIGRHVVALLREKELPYLAIGHRWRDDDALAEQLGEVELAACIHLGWYANPADYVWNVEQNLGSLTTTIRLARLLDERGCRQLVVVGSCAEYAASDSRALESDAIDPVNIYGAAKAAAHGMLRAQLRASEMDLIWARLFNLTGPGECEDRPVAAVARAALRGEQLDMSEGLQVRDFLDVRDVAGALVHLATTGQAGTYNVCSGQPVALRTLFGQIADEAGGAASLVWGARPRHPDDPDFVVGDNARLRATGWAPSIDRNRMVHDVVEYWRRQLSV